MAIHTCPLTPLSALPPHLTLIALKKLGSYRRGGGRTASFQGLGLIGKLGVGKKRIATEEPFRSSEQTG
jgi:hypothetical protein